MHLYTLTIFYLYKIIFDIQLQPFWASIKQYLHLDYSKKIIYPSMPTVYTIKKLLSITLFYYVHLFLNDNRAAQAVFHT